MINGYAQVDLSTVEFLENNYGIASEEIFNKLSTSKPMFITGKFLDAEVSALLFPLHDTDLLKTISDTTLENLYEECDLSYAYWGTINSIFIPQTAVNTTLGSYYALFFVGRIINPDSGNYEYPFVYINRGL